MCTNNGELKGHFELTQCNGTSLHGWQIRITAHNDADKRRRLVCEGKVRAGKGRKRVAQVGHAVTRHRHVAHFAPFADAALAVPVQCASRGAQGSRTLRNTAKQTMEEADYKFEQRRAQIKQ